MSDDKNNFKKATLEALVSEASRFHIKDHKIPGLRLAVYPSGIKTFLLCKVVKGRSQKIKIGRFPNITIEQARNEAARLNSLIILGHDPHEEKKAERLEITFKQLYNIYYNEHALPFTKNPKANKRMIEYHIMPVLGSHRVRTITKNKIRTLHANISENRGKGGAARVLTLVSAIFNFGIKNEYIQGTNPCAGLKKWKSVSRDRFLRLDELKLFFSAVKKEEALFRDFFLLLLYTGARKGNVLSMKWRDLDLTLNRWRIPETQTKNKEVNIVVLSQLALEILNSRKFENDKLKIPSLFVFPGGGVDGYLKEPKKAFQRIRDRMDVEDFRMHDLRRTLGSYMAINGTSLSIIGKALNHKTQASTEIYARLSQNPVEQALNAATRMMLLK